MIYGEDGCCTCSVAFGTLDRVTWSDLVMISAFCCPM